MSVPLRPFGPVPRREGEPGRKRRSSRAAVSVESLEGRALLSHVSLHARSAPPIIFPHPADPHPGPILNEVGTGFAVKSARFYPGYTGSKQRTDLNAAGAKGVIDFQGNLVLTGIVVANQVNQAPTSASQESFYTFAIDRGGAAFPGPIPGRPGIKFDTLVTVAIQQTGITAAVTDLNTGIVTPVSTSNLLFKQNALQITVPASVVTTFGTTGPGRITATFWASSSPNPNDFQSIASFAPEFRGFPIALGAIPHHGRG